MPYFQNWRPAGVVMDTKCLSVNFLESLIMVCVCHIQDVRKGNRHEMRMVVRYVKNADKC